MRTRVKICGITRIEDAQAASEVGVDAVGFIFYPPSPRFLSNRQARALRDSLPPFVTSVALFVDPTPEEVERVLEQVRPDVLQFHGDESPEFCEQFGVPYLKACRVKEGVDLVKYLRPYERASGWLADAFVEAYGGVGESFDWSLVPHQRPCPLILSGGLTSMNVREAISVVRPWGVDVSSGVESAKGIKDPAKMLAFMTEVRNADG